LPKNLVKPALFSVISIGAITLVISISYSSSFLAIFGFALVFWGTVLFYVIPPDRPIFLPSSENIEKIIIKYDLTGKGVYLPSNKLSESGIVFIPKSNFSLNELERRGLTANKISKWGVYISAPGHALCKTFEQQIGMPFTRIKIEKFQTIISKILVDDFALASSVSVQKDETIISIGITGNMLEHVCENTNNQPRTHRQVGCLLASAIACALAKVTGEPVTIQSDISMQARGTLMQFQIVSRNED
jgi:hypothetical protein